MTLPREIIDSALWKRLLQMDLYAATIKEIRSIADPLAAQIAHSLPDLTDHSSRHMDALWGVADQVLSGAEMDALSPSEAFALGACFYIHDLGMVLNATASGRDTLRLTEAYKVAYARETGRNKGKGGGIDYKRADDIAHRAAAREMHAIHATDIATKLLPGVNRYLIESTVIRERWAHVLGEIASSHHWELERLDKVLGIRGRTPSPDSGTIDPAYIACLLRIIDYAHINRDRALQLDRLLRPDISIESAIHWNAQANITGPYRDEQNQLIYGCTEPLTDIDAWWLYFDLASGLDTEIRAVHEYINGRTASRKRFTLHGVKGIERPETFNHFVQLAEGVFPVDIRVQPESMERIVELLGGKQLYGSDTLAPLRELIQNARDAIELMNVMERAKLLDQTRGKIEVVLDQQDEKAILRVRDNGVGMTRDVVLRHLIGVGSDFWHSTEFYKQFRDAVNGDFRPIGKFGIGFLSVFMFGDEIEVETESLGSTRLLLRLHGLGRRGELRELSRTGYSGTEVRVRLRSDIATRLSNLGAITRARAPMLQIPIYVRTAIGGTEKNEQIRPYWWKHVDQAAFMQFISTWQNVAFLGRLESDEPRRFAPWKQDYRNEISGWPTSRPEYIADATRIISLGGTANALVLRCSQGIAIDLDKVDDLQSLVDLGEIELTASRGTITSGHYLPIKTGLSRDEHVDQLLEKIKPAVVEALDGLGNYGMIPGRLSFIRGIASSYGADVLHNTTLSWIPVVEPPGNLIHYSKEQLLERLRREHKVVVGIGVSPGDIYTLAVPQIAATDLAKMIGIAIKYNETKIDYDLSHRLDHQNHAGVVEGSLDEILDIVSIEKEDLLLTHLILSFIAEGWAMNIDELSEQRWQLHYKKDEALWVGLKRGTSVPAPSSQ
jgi:Histidine kinase-, DNA gyrase B-, and HSP90-like ATPase